MSNHSTTTRAQARFNPESGDFELRCNDCAASGHTPYFWPITVEFWNPKRMGRCRACNLAFDARRARERYRENPGPKRRRNSTWERENRETRNLKRRV